MITVWALHVLVVMFWMMNHLTLNMYLQQRENQVIVGIWKFWNQLLGQLPECPCSAISYVFSGCFKNATRLMTYLCSTKF